MHTLQLAALAVALVVASGTMTAMDVLSSRVLLRPSNPERSRRFYRDTLGLAVARDGAVDPGP
jgi:hypothetical protein